MLTEAEIDALADKAYPVGGPRLIALRHAIREAVRLTAERCAALCREHKGYEMEERAADACAAEIEERIK